MYFPSVITKTLNHIDTDCILSQGDNPDPNIRLVDADDQVHPYEGRVQVLSNGVWYEICDDLWGQDDARVVARMLCYK